MAPSKDPANDYLANRENIPVLPEVSMATGTGAEVYYRK